MNLGAPKCRGSHFLFENHHVLLFVFSYQIYIGNRGSGGGVILSKGSGSGMFDEIKIRLDLDDSTIKRKDKYSIFALDFKSKLN